MVDNAGGAGHRRAVRDRRRRHDPRRHAARRRDRAARARDRASSACPKTIDNDIHFIDRSFGFESAFSAAVEVDPQRARRGDGRAQRHRPGQADGPPLGLHRLPRGAGVDRRRLRADPGGPAAPRGRGRRVRATSSACSSARATPSSSSPRAPARTCASRTRTAARDATRAATPGSRTSASFCATASPRTSSARGLEVTLKYIDPSYTIRSVPASPSDSVYCWNMARNAVHAAMAGNTEMLIGRWHGRFVHVPMPLATRSRKQVDSDRRPVDVGDRGDRAAQVVPLNGPGPATARRRRHPRPPAGRRSPAGRPAGRDPARSRGCGAVHAGRAGPGPGQAG